MSNIKDFIKTLNDKPILLFGLGRSGLSTLKALKAAGAKLVVGDDSAENIDSIRDLGVSILNDAQKDFSEFAFLLLSPGIPLTHPEPHYIVKKAKEADLDIICDIELFSRIYPDIKTIGVTGTNGKSTTTTLINHILNECGKKSQLGGNIGTPVFELDVSGENKWVVLEISSFQMDLCPVFRPDISVILNLTPDHLDRHGDMNHYMEVKERIADISQHSEYNTAIICSDDLHMQKIYDRANNLNLRDIVEVSTVKNISNGIYVSNNILFDNLDNAKIEIGNLSTISNLKGIHNYQNAACAYATVKKLGLSQDEIWNALKTFSGLNHRQYHVQTINGVDYINDSKATNVASTAMALGCQNNVYWIVGGRQKKTGLEGLEDFFPNIKHAFLIGDSTEDFAIWLDKYAIEYTRCYLLEKALTSAHEMAQENRGQPGGAGVVLLSPACASFDQFKSFEDRGDSFATMVKDLE